MNIKHRIDIANTLLSWRLTQQIESAYSRILAAGRAANPELNGSCEYHDVVFENCTFTSGNGGISVGLIASAGLDKAEVAWLVDTHSMGRTDAKQQFIRSAVWFWCLLFGHWEYYEGEKSV